MVVPCAVRECEDKKSPRHRFPNPDKDRNRFNTWVSLICNPKLTDMDPSRIYSNYRICHRHFLPSDIATNKYLKHTALPSQELPTAADDQDLPVQVALHTEHSTAISTEYLDRDGQLLVDNLPSTSKTIVSQAVPCTSGEVTPRESTPPISVEASNVTPTSVKTDPPSLLKSVGVSRSGELTPKARTLYKHAKRLQSKASVYRSRACLAKRKLKLARKFERTPDFSNTGLRSETVNFCMQQLMRKRTAPKGRRFTLDEKIMSLALYKTSGPGYRFLSKWFNLPSKRTLSRLLEKIRLNEGISEYLLENLRQSIAHFKSNGRLCTIMFDEIALMPFAQYSKSLDQIIGVRDGIIMDHALVFMVRGVTRKWKQTVAYQFCKGTTKSQKIVELLGSVIRNLKKIGLTVVATICDQGATNKAAIESMVLDARGHYLKNNVEPKRRIIIGNEEIIPLYDVPHLIKGIRNNFLTKNIIWPIENNHLVGKWADIERAYHIDNASGEIRCLTKLTDQHVIVSKIKKMKVSCATQVFSHSLASVINLMARKGATDLTGTYKMEARSQDTAQILKFFDSLFDSLNGGTFRGTPGKPLKGAVTENSRHIFSWRNSIQNLKRMYFQKEGTTEKIVPPSLKNFVLTLEGFIDLTETLFSKNVKYFFARTFNQDPLENFFGQIRQHRGGHTNPSCLQFSESYKALLIRNITGTHSAASNCEETYETSLIQLKYLLNCNINIDTPSEIIDNASIHKYISSVSTTDIFERPLSKAAIGYVSGFIAKKVLKKFKCEYCKIHILKDDRDNSEYLELVKEKECVASKNSLFYCNDLFIGCITKAYNIAKFILANYNIEKDTKRTIIYYVKAHVTFSFVCDHKEELVNFISNYIVYLCIFVFCKGINNIITGKESRISTNSCTLYKEAFSIYKKRYNK